MVANADTSAEGNSTEKSIETAAASSSQQHGNARISIDEMLKGLLISQIRAPVLEVEEGLINLLRECVMTEENYLTSAYFCGHVDHYQSSDDEDLGWGCGWRNIQILCSFLLAEDQELREILFGGAGFVPDIAALQAWLEIAWAKGFDKPGAEYFNWAISGSRKWIGTTECAALLRSFGVRAHIVSFTAMGGKRTRSGCGYQKPGLPPQVLSDDKKMDTESFSDVHSGTRASSGGKVRGNVDRDCESSLEHLEAASQSPPPVHKTNEMESAADYGEYPVGKRLTGAAGKTGSGGDSNESQRDSEDADDLGSMFQKHVKLPESDESSPTRPNDVCDRCRKPIKGKQSKSLLSNVHEICSNCAKEVDVHPPSGERESTTNYFIIEDRRPSRLDEDEQAEQDSDNVDEKHAGLGQEEQNEDSREDRYEETRRECGGNRVEESEDDEESVQPENDAGSKPLANEERLKAGTQESSSGKDIAGSNNNYHHLIDWVWNYFSDGSTQRLRGGFRDAGGVNITMRSPLYFQHRGHSRTIVGIERRRGPTAMTEDVFLLLLDPSMSSELLVSSLRKKKGWQKLIQYDMRSLRETEYQLCYADRGLAVGEELELSKVLSSLRYASYTR